MDIQKILDNEAQALRNEKLKTSPQLLLGSLILRFEAVMKKDRKVYFDFGNAYPTGLNSWRGSYCELAVEFEFGNDSPTVTSFLKKLHDSVGMLYTGYKGGEFRMGENTPVWVANYGNSGNTAVVGLTHSDHSTIIIETRYCEY